MFAGLYRRLKVPGLNMLGWPIQRPSASMWSYKIVWEFFVIMFSSLIFTDCFCLRHWRSRITMSLYSRSMQSMVVSVTGRKMTYSVRCVVIASKAELGVNVNSIRGWVAFLSASSYLSNPYQSHMGIDLPYRPTVSITPLPCWEELVLDLATCL